MPFEAPQLSESDLASVLSDLHRTDRRTLDTAVYGRGEPGVIQVEIRGEPVRYRVVPVRCELELRRALVTRDDTRLVALVDYDAEKLPLDIAARLAHGEVRPVPTESRLRQRFHVRWIHPDLQRLRPLCAALLEEGGRGALPPGAAQLDVDTAWRLIVARRAGISEDTVLTLRGLFAHLATTPPTPRWLDWMRANPELRAPFEAWLTRRVDTLAPALWTAWEERLGPTVAALTFALGPLTPRLDELALRMQAQVWVERVSPALAQHLGQDPPSLGRWAGCERHLRDALKQSDPRVLGGLLREADTRVADAAREPTIRAALATSELLTLAWNDAQAALALALDDALANPGRERFEAARDALERLRRHRLAQENERLLDRVRAALRLVGWMSARRDLAHLDTGGPVWQLATELARDYVQQGGFADLCRMRVRGSEEGPLGKVLRAVEARADALRDEDDRRFTASLRGYHEHGRREEGVIPIEKALARFAVPFLKSSTARRRLVILLDGASWPDVIEILLDLEERRHGVLRWQPLRGSSGPFVAPVLAALPTETVVSRAAFFTGAVPEPGSSPNSSLDPKRFASHAELRECAGAAPKLLLQPDVETPSGHASNDALSLVRSEARVVGVVLNAIDDQLHGSRQVEVRYTAATIKPLTDLLDAARENARVVLFASDHGHVSGARLVSVSPRRDDDGKARWRTLDEGATPDPGEMAVRGAGVWTPRKGQTLAVRTRETEVRGQVPGGGTHGGATLAEVVAPTVLLVHEDLRDAHAELQRDAELEARPLPRPAWWDLEWPATARRVVTVAEKTVQPSLPLGPVEVATPTPVAPPSRTEREPPALTALGRAMASAETFKGLSPERRRFLHEKVIPIVELLHARGGTMDVALFERALQQLPGRGEQIVTAASELTNIEAYPVLSYEASTRLVRLDATTLCDLLDLREALS